MICKKIVLADLASPLGDAAQFSVCEDLLNIVAAMTVELIQIGGTDAVSIAYAVCDAHPALEGRYGQEYIASLGQFLLGAELPGVSARLQRLFDDWNVAFFANRLSPYSVRVVFDIHTFANEPVFDYNPSSGLIRFAERCIYVRYEEEKYMLGMLIHEMAHAATDGNHDETWNNEMKRLRLAGAPVLAFDID